MLQFSLHLLVAKKAALLLLSQSGGFDHPRKLVPVTDLLLDWAEEGLSVMRASCFALSCRVRLPRKLVSL